MPKSQTTPQAVETIPATEVAKLVRQALRTEFGKAIKFTARTRWSGLQQTVYVTWSGIYPSRKQVIQAVGHFRGADTDQLDNWINRPTLWQGKQVQFGNSYISIGNW